MQLQTREHAAVTCRSLTYPIKEKSIPVLKKVKSSGRYNRQGRKAKNRRSRDSYSNRAYSRTQTARNTGTHNLPLYLTRATIGTNDRDTLVHIGDLGPRQHRTACSSCQEVSTTTIHGPLTLDQRHAESPMRTSQEGTKKQRLSST